jgi:hypothetical protein
LFNNLKVTVFAGKNWYSYHGNLGVMEYWSSGVMEKISNTPVLQHSNTPVQYVITPVVG